jgi:hypothetical protein
VIALEILLRLGRTLIVAFVYIVSALCRIALSWAQNRRSIKLKTGPEPGGGSKSA